MLTLYQFNTGVARHMFCRVRGIHPFTRPRTAPDDYTINVRCIESFDVEQKGLERRTFDERLWKEAVKTYRHG